MRKLGYGLEALGLAVVGVARYLAALLILPAIVLVVLAVIAFFG